MRESEIEKEVKLKETDLWNMGNKRQKARCMKTERNETERERNNESMLNSTPSTYLPSTATRHKSQELRQV